MVLTKSTNKPQTSLLTGFPRAFINSSQSSRSVKVEFVVAPVLGSVIWDNAEGVAASAGGKKTCQNEIAVGV